MDVAMKYQHYVFSSICRQRPGIPQLVECLEVRGLLSNDWTLQLGSHRACLVPAAGLQVDQTSERWSFSTNTGVSSSISPDLPEDQITLSFSLGEMTFPTAVSSITFHHHGAAGSADSVTPGLILRCVPPATTTTLVAPVTTVAPVKSGPRLRPMIQANWHSRESRPLSPGSGPPSCSSA